MAKAKSSGTKKAKAVKSNVVPVENLSRPECIKEFQRKEADTGSPEVQIALLTSRIKSLNDHFLAHPKDFHSRRGLMKMISARRKLLKYLERTKPEVYFELLNRLGIRH